MADGALDDHDGIMETAFDFRDELLCAAAEDKRACFGCRTAFEEVEAFVADLTFFKFGAGTEVLGLDVGAGGGDGAAGSLNDALEVVGGDAAGAEDVAVGEVPGDIMSADWVDYSMQRAATYCVAKSPIGSLLSTTFAPVLYNASILLYMICHSASTMAWYSDT